MTRTFVDRGGTFTDVVVVEDGPTPRVEVRKVPSDQAVVGELARGALVVGTTVATNALLERRGVSTLLLVTEGFGDLPRLRHMARPELFDPDAAWPAPLGDRVVEVRGRLAADGAELTPLTLPDLDLDGVQAVAIALLHAPRNPAHERAVAAHVARLRPDLYVVQSHTLASDPGYLARVETAWVDAAITPHLRAALARDRVPADALAIRSDGGLCPAHELRAPDAVLSGPAGGVLAVRHVARALGFGGAVGLDMGGTSTDVCVVEGDALPWHPEEVAVAGVMLRRPMLQVDTIAAGGGSVLWHDGARLRVGPQSAGADPGPQCWGRGGPPTLTDAALAAGLVDPEAARASRGRPLDPDRVDLPAPAEHFLAVAREEIAGAVAACAGRRGVDVRALPLVAYGGAAGQHAAAVAARLGIRTVLVHPWASVLSAFGQALTSRVQEGRAAAWRPLDVVDLPALLDDARRGLPDWPDEEATVALRRLGTQEPLEVPYAPDPAALSAAFAAAHRRVTGLAPLDGPLEVVAVRVRRALPAPPPPEIEDDPWDLGDRIARGPIRLDGGHTSVFVPAGWTARRDRGVLRLDAPAEAVSDDDAPRSEAAALAIWGARLMDVATRAGEQLRRLAVSVSIRERRDFSMALFHEDGRLVANAPHVPVHLGAMGETVRDLIAHVPPQVLRHGSAWLTNAPDAGGSHLPDLTVVTVVQHGARRFFVASRGHHADVGGATPGSMPPFARTLDEEGLVFRRLPLLTADGQLVDLREALRGSRQPEVVAGDLVAQIGANAAAAADLLALAAPDALAEAMDRALAAGGAAVRALLPSLRPGVAEDEVDGVPLRVAITPLHDRLRVDLSGTGGPNPGNRNAPRGVVRAAVLYALRVRLADDQPLHEGVLDAVDLVLPPGSLVDPPSQAAVSGGNVETSQALVDLLFEALDLRAASQGTMNNLTLGGPGWSLYETLGGGTGATALGDGAGPGQVHMTNTRATDPEVLELRLPVRVIRFAIRRGSGGAGRRRGGDGLIRELEVTAPATAALLASRRDRGPRGLRGGGPGLAGVDTLTLGGVERVWDGAPTALAPGDRVRVETPGGGGYGPPPEVR